MIAVDLRSVDPRSRLRVFLDDLYFFLRRPRRAPAHYHGCPSCYEYEACAMDCFVEPDLGEHKGCGIGAYDVCSTCRKAGRSAP